MLALPTCRIALTAKISKRYGYPKDLKTLGDHIKTKRLDSNMFQKDVAHNLHVSPETVCNWETNTTEPHLTHMGRITDFLGYCLITPAPTVGTKIVAWRTSRGVSRKALAERLGIDPDTLRVWEEDRKLPPKKHQGAIKKLFEER